MHLNQAVVKGQINGAERIKGPLDIHLNGFNYNDINVNQLKLSATGDEQKHSLQLISDGDPIAANLNLTGNFDRTLQPLLVYQFDVDELKYLSHLHHSTIIAHHPR